MRHAPATTMAHRAIVRRRAHSEPDAMGRATSAAYDGFVSSSFQLQPQTWELSSAPNPTRPTDSTHREPQPRAGLSDQAKGRSLNAQKGLARSSRTAGERADAHCPVELRRGNRTHGGATKRRSVRATALSGQADRWQSAHSSAARQTTPANPGERVGCLLVLF